MPLATWSYETVEGMGWALDDELIPMDGPLDLAENLVVYMDSLGTVTSWTNESI